MKRDLNRLTIVLSLVLIVLITCACLHYIDATKNLTRVQNIQETIESQFEGGAQ